jgi:hypothetical protein
MRRAILLLAALGVVACRPDTPPPSSVRVEAPVSSPDAIPDAPLGGTLLGKPFALRDARYVVDSRAGYQHTDIALSAGAADAPCFPVAPARSPSVWLRLEGPGAIEANDLTIAQDGAGPWSVHYQVFDGERWVGVGQGSALLSIRDVAPDGRVSGGLAVCFADDAKSCVSGSFVAVSCPPTIDQPVRGAPPLEPPPPEARR